MQSVIVLYIKPQIAFPTRTPHAPSETIYYNLISIRSKRRDDDDKYQRRPHILAFHESLTLPALW
jgi:hypothetical protein